MDSEGSTTSAGWIHTQSQSQSQVDCGNRPAHYMLLDPLPYYYNNGIN